MADTGGRPDPLTAFRFTLRLGDLKAGGFSGCSGLKLSTPMLAYPEGGLNTYQHKLPSATQQTDLVLKRGLVDRVLWDWYWDLVQGAVTPRSGSVAILAADGARVEAEWTFSQALPTAWEGPALDASQSSVAIETLTLAHQGLQRTR